MKCHIDMNGYIKKPSNTEIKLLNKRITKYVSDVDVNTFISFINNGYSFLPSIMNGERKKDNFISTELFFLDFDNAIKKDNTYIRKDNYLSLNDCLQMEFTQKNALICYETFNSDMEISRFRLVFRLPYKITSEEEFKYYYSKLLEIYPQADKSCNDISRLFFGGKNAQIVNEHNFLNVTSLGNSSIRTYDCKNPIKNKVIPNKTIYTSNIAVLNHYLRKDYTYLANYYLRKNLNLAKTYKNDKAFLKEFNKLNMYLLFGLPSDNFKCRLNEEKHPSCSIMLLSNGDYIYKRFSESSPLNLNNFQFIRSYLEFSFEETLELLKVIFDVEILEREKVKKLISSFIENISNKDIKKSHKRVYKILYRYRNVIEGLFEVMFSKPIYKRVFSNAYEYQYISTFSTRTLAQKVLGADNASIDTKRKRVNNLLLSLAYIGVLSNLSDEDLDPYTKNLVYSAKLNNQSKNRTNVYKLNIDMLNLDKLEKYICENIPADFTVTKISVDYILMHDTKQVIVQSEQKKITDKLDVFISELEDYLVKELSDKDYLLDDHIKEYFIVKYSNKYIKTNYNKCVNLICVKNNIRREYLNKQLREKFNIETNSRLKIVYSDF